MNIKQTINKLRKALIRRGKDREMEMTVETAKNYFRSMEGKRKKSEKYNQKAYNDARELSALVSLAEFGNKDISKQAIKAIKSI